MLAGSLFCSITPHPPQTSAQPPCPRRIVKLVRALRKGWIKREAAPEKPAAYLIWEDDGARLRLRLRC